MTIGRMLVHLAALAAIALGSAPAAAKGPKYAKTEMEKATGKCIGSLLGGALLGAVIGRAISKRGAGTGAAIGAGGGAILCGVLVANAKHRDRVIQAQMTAMKDPRRLVSDTWIDADGKETTFTANAGTPLTIDGSRLRPVRYQTATGKAESPTLDTGNRECRMAGGSFASGGTVTAAPAQLYCRTDAGDWQPFAEATA